MLFDRLNRLNATLFNGNHSSDLHPNFHSLLLSGLVIAFNLFGLFGNSNVIWATWRNKELRNKHGSLMLWFCVFHNLCLLSELSYVFLNNFISPSGWLLSDCLRVSIPHLFASSVQTVLSVSIVLDLLIALLWPFRHRFYSLKRYVFLFLLPAITYAFITTCWALVDSNHGKISWCNGPLALSGSAAIWWLSSNVALNCVNVMIYAVLYALISRNGTQADRIRRLHSDENRSRVGKTLSTEKRVLRSLSVLLAVYLFSWFAYIIGITIVRDLPLSSRNSHLLQSYLVILALICHSQNYYVMFILSNTYRRAFMEQLYILICKEVPEKYWPMSVTASRRASQNWQKARSEAMAVTGGSLHSSVRRPLRIHRRTSSLPDIHKLDPSTLIESKIQKRSEQNVFPISPL